MNNGTRILQPMRAISWRVGAQRQSPKSDSYVDRNWKGPMAWRKESASAPAFVSKKDKSTWQLKALDGLRLLANP